MRKRCQLINVDVDVDVNVMIKFISYLIKVQYI